MDTESLHTLSTAVMALGFVFTGLGGFGLYYFSRAATIEKESRRASGEAELRAKLSALQKGNEELQQRLRASERVERANEPQRPVREPAPSEAAPSEPVRTALAHPSTAPVKIAPPPALVEWAGASMLEEMIESSVASEAESRAALSDQQRYVITSILRKYADRSIAIHSVAGDSAGFEFARSLKAAFEESGWRVAGVEQVFYGSSPEGLFITSGPSSSPEEAIIPHEALTSAGYEVSRCVDSNLKGDKTVLLVGAALK